MFSSIKSPNQKYKWYHCKPMFRVISLISNLGLTSELTCYITLNGQICVCLLPPFSLHIEFGIALFKIIYIIWDFKGICHINTNLVEEKFI